MEFKKLTLKLLYNYEDSRTYFRRRTRMSGIEAISIVERPAIEEDFITLNSKVEYKLAEVDQKKKILLGALLIPNKPILRQSEDGEYYICCQ